MALTLQELLKKVRAVDIAAHHKSNQLLKGDYHSTFQGTGMNFREVRNYQYGDDVRNIDWNVSARMQETHVKIFEEERERCLLLLVDISASNLIGSRGQIKKDRMAEIAATLAFSALANGDKVGAILFTNKIEKYIPPKKGKQNIFLILKHLIDTPSNVSKETDISQALNFMLQTQNRKAICFILSDFISPDFSSALKASCFRHAVTGLHIYDAIEQKMPALGLLQMRSLESDLTTWVDTSNAKIRQQIEQTFIDNQSKNEKIFTRNKAKWLSLSTEEDYSKTLHLFFKNK